MRKIRRFSICLLFIILAVVAFVNPILVFASENEFTIAGGSYKVTEVVDKLDVGYGIYYHRDIAASKKSGSTGFNPQQVNVLEVTPSDEVFLVPFAYLAGSKWTATSVKKAALQYETIHPGYKVVAGINGDFFKINDAVRASTGVTVSQGEYYKAISHHNASEVNTLAIRNNGEGKQLFNTRVNDSYPVLSIYDENNNIIKKIDVNKVNAEPGANEISLYYAQRETNFGQTLIYIKASNVWVIDKADYAVTSSKNSFYGVGKITSFSSEETEIGVGQFAIKCNNSEINEMLKENVKIRVQYEYKDPSLDGVESFIGFPYQLVANSEYVANKQVNNGNWAERHPRTMIGQKENGDIVLAVVDGRQESKGMYGVTGTEMAALMGYYGCVDSWNLDGGGSSTLIIRKQNGWVFNNENNGFNTDDSSWYVTNSPSDSVERNDGNQLFVVVKVPEVQIDLAEIEATSIKLNVALISELDKYANLYILLGKEYYPVQDGLVEITGLTKDKEYTLYLYAKVGDDYIDLMTSRTYKTSKLKPTKVDLEVSLYRRNGEQVLFRYLVDNTQAVRTIVFVGNNGEEFSTSAQTIMLEKAIETYNMINGGKIQIKYIANPTISNEEEVLVVETFDIKFDLMFLVDEMVFTTNNAFENLFK